MKKMSTIFKTQISAAFFIVGFLWISTSCDKLDKLTQFHINFSDTITIPSLIGVNLPFNIISPAISTNASEVFEINDTRKDLIEEIKLEDLLLIIIDPKDSDFSFLKSIEIYLETDSIEATLIAWKYEIDNSIGNTLDLEVTEDDLTKYIISDKIELKVTTVTDKILLSDIQIEIQAGFFVNAKILGI